MWAIWKCEEPSELLCKTKTKRCLLVNHPIQGIGLAARWPGLTPEECSRVSEDVRCSVTCNAYPQLPHTEFPPPGHGEQIWSQHDRQERGKLPLWNLKKWADFFFALMLVSAMPSKWSFSATRRSCADRRNIAPFALVPPTTLQQFAERLSNSRGILDVSQ